jgi:APA family basic amino acid/polyamine antiporter
LFGKVHPRFHTPYVTTVLTGVVVAIVAGLFPIATLTQLTAMGTLLAFVMVSIGILVLRRTEPNLPRPFRTPWMPWVPILGALICLAQMLGLPWRTWERLIIWLALGLAIYFLYGRRGAERMRARAAERNERSRAAKG